MMKLVACIAFMSVISTQTAAADFNPYLKPTDELGRRLQAAAFGEAGADRALQDWLVAHPEVASEEQIQGYHQLCNDYDALTWFQLRLTACACYQQLKEKSAGATDRHATAFAGQPPARTIGSTIVPLTWNAFGCQSVEVVSNRVSSSWFVDTGAEITVVKASLAKRMGIRPVAAKIGMGTATADVAGGAGIIDRLQIGNAIVENVPVIILPDSQLNVPGVGQIDGILGLQVFVAFGRIAWVNGGRNLALGETAPRARATAARIYWHDEGLGVPIETGRGVQGAHLDTGANTSFWRQAGLALLDPSLIASAKERDLRVGGVGGIVDEKQRVLPTVSFRLGQVPLLLHNVRVMQPGPISAARIGMDAVSEFGTFILDFEQMRIDGRLKTAAERKATRKPVLTHKDVTTQ